MTVNWNMAEFIRSAAKSADFPCDGLPQIVFAGRSNVGKSSAINRLLNRKNFARVGSAPGKTTHINYFLIDKKLYLVDLPGYGYAKVSKAEKERWADLVEGYFAQNRRVAIVFQLVDFRRDPTEDDFDMIRFLRESGFSFVVVCTKCDKLNKTETAVQLERYREIFSEAEIPFLPFSAVSGEGAEELRTLLTGAVEHFENRQ